jgi:hypothetical protein
MAEHVISHREPRRKRAGWWSFAFRRFGALAVTIAALVTATWLAPYISWRAPPPLPGKVAGSRTMPTLPPPSATTEVLLITAGEAASQPSRPRRARRGVPLDAHPGDAGEDFEVLSTGELDAISQARN